MVFSVCNVETTLNGTKLNKIFPGDARKRCLIKIDNEIAWYVMIVDKSCNALLEVESFFSQELGEKVQSFQ